MLVDISTRSIPNDCLQFGLKNSVSASSTGVGRCRSSDLLLPGPWVWGAPGSLQLQPFHKQLLSVRNQPCALSHENLLMSKHGWRNHAPVKSGNLLIPRVLIKSEVNCLCAGSDQTTRRWEVMRGWSYVGETWRGLKRKEGVWLMTCD